MVKTWLLLGLLCVVGCASEARLPVSYFAESGTVLEPGTVALTGVAGAGQTTDGKGAGAGGRVRVGIGDGQELGVEAASVVLDSPSEHCTAWCETPDTRFQSRSRSALLSYKRQLRPELAVIAGLGGSQHALIGGDPMPSADSHGRSLDATFGAVRSWRVNDGLDMYTGARFSAALPVGVDSTQPKASRVLGVAAAVGADVRMGSALHLYLEGGGRSSLVEGDGLTFGATVVGGVGLVL